jgi:L-ascorbate metabolism protein UlaG (beta-lactamase superfamily)
MKITHYLYNAFVIEDGDTKVAIDPGKNLGIFKLGSLIPESEWASVSHVLVTHGDPDHFEYAAPLAKASHAKVISGRKLEDDFISRSIEDVHSIDVGEVIDAGGVRIEGVQVEHGRLYFKLGAGLFEMKNTLRRSNLGGQEIFIGPIRLQKKEDEMRVSSHGTVRLLFGLVRLEKDNVDFARGSVGFKISIGNRTVVNLGDSVYREEWKSLNPDILMLPIGGLGENTWTMDIKEALKAVELISPALVIPCHYNVPFLWQKRFCPADDQLFKREVEKMGVECRIMGYGDEIVLH